MSYKIRRSQDRGFFDHGWLKTYHTFSFAAYQDPKFMGFRGLRVINEDRVEKGQGFGTHSHKNMEIITIVLEGELAHKDSTGTEETLYEGDVQAMSAGSGVSHSEFNPSSETYSHFLQIWILPDTQNVTPEYRQTKLKNTKNEWQLLASKKGEKGSMLIHQDVNLYYIYLDKEKSLPASRYGFLHLIEGEVQLNDDVLKTGDAAAIEPNTQIKIESKSPSRLIYFDLR